MRIRRWVLFAATAAFALGAYPCTLHTGKPRALPKASPTAKAIDPVWVGPAHSGSWYTPSRSGEGFTLQILENGSALSFWFTYPPAGSNATQAWIVAQDGRVDGNRIRFTNVFTTRGPRFGASFDPAQVQTIPWGTIEFRFLDCNRGEVTFAGPEGWGSGTREIVRLTALSELECSGKKRVALSGARTLAGIKQRSGAWYDPAHNGEGWKVEELPDGRAQVYWFTYDDRGEQAWTIGVAPTTGDTLEIAQMLQPTGTRFGSGFNASAITPQPWGRLTLSFNGCEQGVANYQSSLPAFGSGTLRPVRLTRLSGASCVEGTPTVPANGTWSAGALMPQPQSEVATAGVAGKSCVAGGYAALRDFKCYDPAANTWATLAALPAGRDHALALTIDGDMHVIGGYGGTDSAGQPNGWRYRSASGQWEAVPQLPNVVASGAAMMGGFAYFGDISGDLFQYNPVTLETRRIRGDGLVARDHSQVVAFQGEIWMIGGRGGLNPENGAVSIYDPASETWRTGPTLGTRRAGFAAAATPTAILIAGGERILTPTRVIDSVEAIAAGDEQWRPLPPLPFAMHGVGGVIQGNSFTLLGGSRVAAQAFNEGQVQVYRW